LLENVIVETKGNEVQVQKHLNCMTLLVSKDLTALILRERGPRIRRSWF
jgi:hypothetical protein